MKKVIAIALLNLIACSSGSTKGVSFSFIQEQFKLPNQASIIVDVDKDDVCPKMEFDSGDTDSFQVRIDPGNPIAIQSTFEYAEDEYEADGSTSTLRGENSSGSNFEFSYDAEKKIYSIIVDYNCKNATDKNCVNSLFSCSGPRL